MTSLKAPTRAPFSLRKTLVMVGMMGSGKTAIGRAVAQKLAAPFKDSDEEIVAASNSSIAEIFERDGEAFFRDRESEVLQRLLDDVPCVLSPGGGAFLRAENRAAIHAKGASLWLDVPLAVLWERVRHKDTRPLLRTDNPYQTLSDLLSARRPAYQEATLRLEVSPSASIEETADRVIALLAAQDTLLEPRHP